MMTNSAIPVITLWEEFLKQHKEGDVIAFAHWVLKRGNPDSTTVKEENPVTLNHSSTEMGDNEQAMLLIYRLHRLVEIKSKPIIKKIGFVKPLEYAMLAEIYLLKTPNKKEIAQRMLLENSTAVEITNRLVQQGLIKEIDDPNDKRSTRLSITDNGMKKLIESYAALERVHTNFLDCFSDKKKKELVKLLAELERYQSMK